MNWNVCKTDYYNKHNWLNDIFDLLKRQLQPSKIMKRDKLQKWSLGNKGTIT